MATPAHTAPSRKKGLKPAEKRAGPDADFKRGMGMTTSLCWIRLGGRAAPSLGARRARQLVEQRAERRIGFAWLRNRLGGLHIARLANDDQADHAHRVMRLALVAVDAWLIESDDRLFAYFEREWRRAVRDHPVDRLDIVAFVRRDEAHRVAGRDLYERRLEDEHPVRPLVQHLDLHFRRRGGEAERGRGESRDEQ